MAKSRINFILPDNMLAACKTLAARRGTSYSEIIRVALRQYLVEELKREKDAA